MMVNLAPGAVRTLFDIAPASMSDQTESLRDHVLEELLLKCQDQGPAVLTRALCDFMKSRQGLQPGCFDDHRKRIHGVIRSLRDRVHGERVNDYADNFGITSRTLQRMVRAEVGLAPKQVLSTSRLRELISMTNGGWTRSAADLAQTGGYFDQSHLRHELQRLGFGSVSNLIGGDHLVVQR